MEKLFTPEQLREITAEAVRNFDTYLDTWMINGCATETTIITISKHSNLIFTEGNEETGYQHLSDRHNYFSYKHYWKKEENEEYKLDKPSKFFPGFMPIRDYIAVADEIFKPDNKNITPNHHPDLFDKYTGPYQHGEMPVEKYHLLTYRDTRIVHTLFPDKKKHNPKIKCIFARGFVQESLKYPEGFNDMFLPFLDHTGETRYSITIRRYYGQLLEHILLAVHDHSGEIAMRYLVGERELEHFKTFDHQDMYDLQHADLTEFEQIINAMHQESI
ncbi:MAG: hypothetical protein HYU70_00625 [Bacteroidetes bacterium]|nr:hypothetical protein [Bacteroidota bacterium]